MDDPAIEEKAERLLAAKEAAREYRILKEDLEDDLKLCDRAIIGTKFQAEWKKSKIPSYDLPFDVENQIKGLKEPHKKYGRTLYVRSIGE